MSHFDKELDLRYAKMMEQTPVSCEVVGWKLAKSLIENFGSRNDAVTGCLAASSVARDTKMEDAYAV